MRLRLRILGTDHYHEIPEWDFERKPFQMVVYMELADGSEVYDERYFQLEITGKRIEVRQ